MARQSAHGVPVLLTRPKADSESFAAALTARFGARVRPVVAPLLAPRFLTPDLPAQDYCGVIFTSSQAVEGARRLGVALPRRAWCVGHKTAEVASKAGFDAISADGDADDLIEVIKSDPPNGRILYLRGVDTRGNIPETLNYSGIDTDVAIVYAQEAQPLGAMALVLLTTPSDLIVPLFSPRTAALFRAALPADAKAHLHFATMSAAVAEPIQSLPHTALVIARRPDAKAMLDAVDSLLAGLPPP
ncbi:MAG: uroporphyrinogen-III synthase [Tabrizicola sp.]